MSVPTGWGNVSVQGNVAAWNGAATLSPASGPVVINTVFVQDLRTGEQRQVARTEFEGGQIGTVRTDGRWIVWTDLQRFSVVAGEWRIKAMDLETNVRSEVARNTTPGDVLARFNVTWPSVGLDAGRVVWDEAYAHDGQLAVRIHLSDLSTKEERVLIDSTEDGLLQPTISGTRVAFVRVRGALRGTAAAPTITVMDLPTGGLYEPESQSTGFQPSLSNDALVWKAGQLGDWGDIVLYDFAKRSTRVVSRDEGDLPTIGERYVAWQGKGFGYVGLFDRINASILTVPGGGRPAAQGDVVAWVSVDQPDPNWRGSIRYIRTSP